jgi:hypothetical protein
LDQRYFDHFKYRYFRAPEPIHLRELRAMSRGLQLLDDHRFQP